MFEMWGWMDGLYVLRPGGALIEVAGGGWKDEGLLRLKVIKGIDKGVGWVE